MAAKSRLSILMFLVNSDLAMMSAYGWFLNQAEKDYLANASKCGRVAFEQLR